MPKVAIVAALEREISGLIRTWNRVEQQYDGRNFVFFEQGEMVAVAGGIGVQSARRAAEAVIALYHPAMIQSVGFAGALDAGLRVGDLFMPAAVIDARDGSRIEIDGAASQEQAVLVTFMEVAGVQQKKSLAKAYSAQAVDMEAAAVGAAAHAHGIAFAVTKVISDESDFEMPQTACFIDPNGGFSTASFAAFIVLRPWLWRRVALLAGNSRKAAKALSAHLERYRQELSRTPESNHIPVLESISRSPEGVKRI
jgi:nucleoside phosphorylase